MATFQFKSISGGSYEFLKEGYWISPERASLKRDTANTIILKYEETDGVKGRLTIDVSVDAIQIDGEAVTGTLEEKYAALNALVNFSSGGSSDGSVTTTASAVPTKSVTTVAPFQRVALVNWARMPTICYIGSNKILYSFNEQRLGETGEHCQRLSYCVVEYDPATNRCIPGTISVYDEPTGWADGTLVGGSGNSHMKRVGGTVQAYYMFTSGVGAPGGGGYYEMRRKDFDIATETWEEGYTVVLANTVDYSYISGSNGDIAEITSGEHEGRWVMPIWRINHNTLVYVQGSIYSDNQGTTWTMSNFVTPPVTGSENTIVWNGEKCIMWTRAEATYSGTYPSGSYVTPFRMRCESTDGATWSAMDYDYNLITPACNASAINYGTYKEHENVILFTCPSSVNNNVARNHFKVRASLDGGQSFPIEYYPLAPEQNGGYSCIRKMDNGLIAIAVESNTQQGNGFNSDEGSKIIVLNLEEIIENQIVKTEEDYYDEYEIFVGAKGGEIIDPVYTLSRIADAIEHGFHKNSIGISASFGLKKTGSTINEVYSLFNKMVFAPAGPSANVLTYVADGDGEFIKGENLRWLGSPAFYGSFKGTFAWGLIFKHVSVFTVNAFTGIEAEGNTTASPIDLVRYNTVNSGATQLGHLDANGTYTVGPNFIANPLAPLDDLAIHVDIEGGTYETFINGAPTTTGTKSLSETKGKTFDYRETRIKAMIGAHRVVNVIEYGTEIHTAEWWVLTDPTREQTKNLFS